MSNKIRTIAIILFGLAELTFVVFFALKVTKIITWSWTLVTLPLWGVVGFTILFSITAGLITALCEEFLR